MNDMVIAIGGNALIKAGQTGTIYEQFANARNTCEHLAKLVKGGNNIVITHGNGPQVGLEMLRNEIARSEVPPNPLGICDANTQGQMGYMLQQTMYNTLSRHDILRPVVTVITQVVVDANDPSFSNPSKPIGKFYTKKEIDSILAKEDWTVVEDSGRGWRRVVPSPIPKEIVEIDAIRTLLDKKYIVIAVGGGGLPVIRGLDGGLEGVEAVVDKDRASAILASQLGVERFMILTAVENVFLDYGTDSERKLRDVSLSEIKEYYEAGQFPPGSMGPKIESAIHFLENGGQEVFITDIHLAEKALQGEVGTRIYRD